MSSYSDLLVWQKSIDLCVSIYKITENFPKSEQFGITSQLRRAATSIPSNIAEGQKRGHNNEFIQFCRIAYGSAAELDTQLLLCQRLDYLNLIEYEAVKAELKSVSKMLNRLIQSLDAKSKT